MKEEWNNYRDNWNKKNNFQCFLTDSGKWGMEKGLVFGKWLLVMDKKGFKNCPSNTDVRNILSGLLEAERRNDIFRLDHKEVVDATPQKREQLRKLRECLDEVESDWNEEKEEAQKKL